MPNPTAEIFSQGDEVVTGEIVDTNAAWLARELTGLGFDVARHTTVGDRLEALVALLREIAGRADLCICTGGLGPTCDDLTAEAVGRAFGLPLEPDEVALAQVESWFTRLGRDMPAVNRKQALLPHGAERLDNLWGTAPGFAVQAGRCRLVFLPGVPGEMKAMFGRWVKPDLPRRFALRPDHRVVLRTIGLGESTLQERLDRLTLPPEVALGFRAGGPENQVKLRFPAEFPQAERDAVVRAAAAAIGEAVYAIDSGADPDGGLEAVVDRELKARDGTLYAVETLSGGLLAQRCAGRSWFLGAAVVADSLRWAAGFELELSGTPAQNAARIAERARALSGADFALAQWASGASAEEGAGTEVHLALAGPAGMDHEAHRVRGGAARQGNHAAALALDFLRRRLQAGRG
jgi:nicotinamide-nucleotide amidase